MELFLYKWMAELACELFCITGNTSPDTSCEEGRFRTSGDIDR